MHEPSQAIVHGVPGEGARARGVLKVFTPLMGSLFMSGLLIGMALPRLPLWIAGFGLLIIAAVLAWTIQGGLRNVSAFFKGARGEERVALLLEQLPAGYHVFHDFPLSASTTVDHVVVGKQGLFVIETKCWLGTVSCQEGHLLVNGKRPSRSPLEQVQASTRALTSFFAMHLGEQPLCTPMVCFASNTLSPSRLTVGAITVCNSSELIDFILSNPVHLSPNECERLVKIMEQSVV